MNENIENPTMKLPPLKRICMTIGQLPASYVESMSYYEMLVWFIHYLRDDVIPVVNANGEAVEELQELYVELQGYVNNYFDNLDVQEEINNKLDEMAEGGQLTDIIAQYLGLAGMITFNTVAEMKLAENLVNGSKCATLGYYNVNDGGNAFYKVRTITNDDVVDEKFIIALYDNSLIAELIIEEPLTIEQIGAKGDGITDDSSYFQAAINKGCNIKCNKSYKFNSSITDNSTNNLEIIGNGKTNFIDFHLIKNIDVTNNYTWVHPYLTKLKIYGINFTSVNNIIISSGSQTIIENCNFTNVNTILVTPYQAYLDTVIFKNVTIGEYRTTSGLTNYYVGSYTSTGSIGSTFLGDMYNFENVHMTGGTSSETNHGRIFGYFYGQESVVFTNCLNIRAKFLQANAIFNACHFEDVSGVKDEWVTNSELTFIGCSFFADSFFVSNAKYIGCICTCSPISERFYNSPDVTFVQNDVPEDIDLIVNIESGRIGVPVPLNKEGGIGADTMNSIISDPYYQTVSHTLLSGEYTYTFNYTVNKTMLIGRNVNTSKTVTIDGLKIPYFTISNGYLKYMYGYVTRTDANNNTVWAIIPPRNVSRYVDYGNHINGSKWNSTTPPSTIDNKNVYGFKNGVVFSKSQIDYHGLGLVNQYATSDRTSTTII